MFIESKEYLAQIRRLIDRSDKVDMAVAFWGKGADALVPPGAGRKVRIICNLSSGGTNPEPVAALMQRGFEVRQLDDLHAKVVIGKDAAIVGSANHSTNGLQLEGAESTGWSEAGLLTDDAATLDNVSTWFEAEWKRAQRISPENMLAAQEAWETRFANRPVRPAKSFCDLRKSDLIGRDVYGILWSEEASPEANQAYEAALASAKESGQANARFLANLGFYEEWKSLPFGVSLVSFQGMPDGSYICDGIWRRLEQDEEIATNPEDGPQLQFVSRQKTLLGIRVAAKDERKLEKMLAPRVDALSEQYGDGTGVIFPIHELFPDA